LFIPGENARFVIAVGAGIGAYLLGRRRPAAVPAAALAGALATAAAALALLGVDNVLADDGGWRECGSQLARWLGCGGSGTVMSQAIQGGLAAGLGGAVGAGAGDSLAAEGEGDDGDDGPRKPWWEMSDQERAEYARRIMAAWRLHHPDASWDQFRENLGDDFKWILELDEQQPGFAQRMFDNAVEDWLSGRLGDRVLETFKNIPAGFYEAGKGTLDLVVNAPGMITDLVKGTPGMLSTAADFWLNTSADEKAAALSQLKEQLGEGAERQFNEMLALLEKASQPGNEHLFGEIVGKLEGGAVFEYVTGMGLAKATKAMRGTGLADDLGDATRTGQRGQPQHIEGVGPPPDGVPPAPRDLPTITPQDALKGLLGDYGDVIPQDRWSQVSEAAANTKYATRDEMADAYQQLGQREMGDGVAGFYHRDSNTVMIDADSPFKAHATNHEMVHAAQNPNFTDIMGNDINEGATDYYARKATEAAGHEYPSAYTTEVNLFSTLERVAGPDVARRAVFGEGTAPINELRNAVNTTLGPGTFEDVVDLCNNVGPEEANQWLSQLYLEKVVGIPRDQLRTP
jgi:hypothetical protein